MYKNRLGAEGRGASNSIYSPGVSAIFGGAPTNTLPRPCTTQASVFNEKITYNDSVKPTAGFDAFTDSRFVTSNQAFYSKNVQTKPKSTLASELKSVIDNKASLKIEEKKDQDINVNHDYHKFETALNSHKAKVDQAKMIYKITDLSPSKQKEQTNHAENREKIIKRQQEIANSHAERKLQNKETKNDLKSKLLSQIDYNSQQKQAEKATSLNLGKNTRELNFEAYTRDQLMKQQNLEVGDALRSQLVDNELKRKAQLEEDRKAPERLIRTDDIINLYGQVVQNQRQDLNRSKKEMNISLNNLSNKQQTEMHNRMTDMALENGSANFTKQEAFNGVAHSHANKMNYSSF